MGTKTGERPHVSVRLSVSTSEPNFQIEPAVPGLIQQWIDSPGLLRGDRKLLNVPITIGSNSAAEELTDYLLDPHRRLPVVVTTMKEEQSEELLIDAFRVAKTTAGIASVYIVPAPFTWILTKIFGKFRSVFGGAVRLYMPGFSESDDPYRHRLFLADRLIDSENSLECETWLRRTTADSSISTNRIGREILEFSAVRTGVRRAQADRLKNAHAPDAERLENLEALVESLETQLKAKAKEVDDFVGLAEDAESRASASEQEYRALLYRFRILDQRVPNAEGQQAYDEDIPITWADFQDWVNASFPDKIILTPNARRTARKPEYEDVNTVARCVSWLVEVARIRFLNGGGTLREESVELGVRNTPCGGDAYTAEWHGQSRKVDWHIKNGGNTRDPKRCLRIYYFWEPETEQIVIDHLPSHRRTSAS